MANTKLDRIERDIEKTRAKVLEYQKRLKDLEAGLGRSPPKM